MILCRRQFFVLAVAAIASVRTSENCCIHGFAPSPPSSPSAIRDTDNNYIRSLLPPPPAADANPDDDLFRSIRKTLPVGVQNWLCESGILRAIQDGLVVLGLPALFKEHPADALEFARLSLLEKREVRYGDHGAQIVELFEAPNPEACGGGVVAFVHGGSWGSGAPWMYRLVATSFLSNFRAVALIGYRTFPDARLDGQVQDVGSALAALLRERPDLFEGPAVDALICHSSGAHLGLLHRLGADAGAAPGAPGIRRLVCLSGVYDVGEHYRFEAGRGAEQLSPLRVACGPDLEGASVASRHADDPPAPSTGAPDIFLIHGVNDTTVPYTQSCDMTDFLYPRAREVLIKDLGHADTVFDLMLGGETRNIVNDILLD